MAIIKCKMCGGDIELSADKTYGVCDSCGSTMTLPKIDDEQRAAAFNRGNHFRRIGEFDKALAVYERIVREDDRDAEAHWCCALCRFGIEYVEDPASFEYIPTCHRASFDSFLEDVDYLAAVEHSEGITKRQYQKDGARIAEVQRGILATSQKEEPYDVFICYKETDENGQRTRDSLMAQEIYYQLTEQGRRVFFARITLEDIAGREYEPYIFAALNSAKVMIVVGTKQEYLNAVWVKNEWSRFLAMMRHDRHKLLLPCYRDMDPYDLPEQLSVLQSYDMGKIGFIQDLTRGISKVLDAEKKSEPATVKETVVVQQAANSNVIAQLKRGNMALEDGDWAAAEQFFEEALNNDAECAAAYIGKALCAARCSSVEALAEKIVQQTAVSGSNKLEISAAEEHIAQMSKEYCVPGYLGEQQIRSKYNYTNLSYISTVEQAQQHRKAAERAWNENKLLGRGAKFAEGEEKAALNNVCSAMLKRLDDAIAEAKREEQENRAAAEAAYAEFLVKADEDVKTAQENAFASREYDYDLCKKAVKESDNAVKLRAAVSQLEKLKGYKDADQLHLAASEKLKNAEEKLRLARQRELEKAKRKKQIIAISVVAAIVIVFALILVVDAIKMANAYKNAEALMESGDYSGSVAAFEALGDYKDSAERVNEAKYARAEHLLAEEKFDDAYAAFLSLGEYNDSKDRACDCVYARAESMMESGDYDGAISAFESLGEYKDSADRVVDAWTGKLDAQYAEAEELLEKGEIVVAAAMFRNLGDYKDAKARCAGFNLDIGGEVVSAGEQHSVAVRDDGTVLASGSNKYGQCDISDWTRIVTVSAGQSHTIGLKDDFTVVAAGDNSFGQCDISEWNSIVMVSAGNTHTLGLRADGTVIATGNNEYGQCDVSEWTDIIAISAGGRHSLGLRSDGTVVAAGDNQYGQCDVESWSNITAISAGLDHSVGLLISRTAVATGRNHLWQCDVGNWRDIVAIEAGAFHTVAITIHGTAKAVGYDDNFNHCNVGNWKNIVAISCAKESTIAITADGKAIGVGEGSNSAKFQLSEWDSLVVPE